MSKPALLRPLAVTALGALLFSCAHAPRPGEPPAGGFTETDLVLAPANAYGGVVWFADELEPLEDAVAELLARPEHGGHRVRPLPELRALWANVRQGRLPGVDGRCEAAPPPALLARHLYRGSAEAEPTVRCDAGAPCTLTVLVTVPRPSPDDPHDREEVARYEAELAPGATPKDWAAALRRDGWRKVPSPEPEGGLGIGGLMTPGQAPGVYATLHDVTQTGGWTKTLTTADFQPYASELDICRESGRAWRDWWGQPFAITVDAAGRVGRCEDEHRDHLPPPGFGCTCELLRRLSFGPGAADRRARFYLDTVRVLPGPAVARSKLYKGAYLLAKRSTDPSAILGTGLVSGPALAACLEPEEQALGDLSIPVRFQVGADGRSLRHHVTWASALPKDVRTCLARVLSTAQFDCPLTGAATIDASLEVSVRPYGPAVPADSE